MKKGILLKLLSFVVVTALLCVPVFARPRIQFLDDLMEDMIAKDANNTTGLFGSIDIDLGNDPFGDDAIEDILCNKIRHHHSIKVPIGFDGNTIIEYTLPWNREIQRAAQKLRNQITTTANYHDKDFNFNIQVIFTKDKQPGASMVTCEIIL